MRSSTKKAFFGDYVFEVCENVYEPAEDSYLFAENLVVSEGERVLDMGIGCGILGILAAKKAGEVVAVDVNPYAVRCAKQNAITNSVIAKMSFVQTDLFASLRDTEVFDLILFNAPYLPAENAEAKSWLGRAWAGGTTGRQVIDRFISEAPRHLKRTGRILLMQSSLAGTEETLARFAENPMNPKVMASLALPFFETLVLIEANLDA
jgi:release factor glutamine methyltransferase